MAMDPHRLPKIALFDGLTSEQLAFIAEHARERSYRAGVTLLSQEDPGETFYVIQHGTVRVSMSLNGQQVFLALLATGDTVGEMSLIDSGGRSADVVMQEPTTMICIDRVAFDHLMQAGSTFPRNIMRILARRLRLANVRIQAHCTLDVYGLVAFQLVEFCELYGEPQEDGATLIPIRLTQQDIADLVGAARESVNKVMVAYRKKKFIDVDSRYRITVLDKKGLEDKVAQSA